jgi:hypothetical protein
VFTGAFTSLGFDLSKHPNEHGPKGPVLLAVDQQFGEGATLRVAPELADPVGSLGKVGEQTRCPLKAAKSYADASCSRGYVALRRRDGDGGVLEGLDNSSAFDPHRRAWRTV